VLVTVTGAKASNVSGAGNAAPSWGLPLPFVGDRFEFRNGFAADLATRRALPAGLD
jgi:hypothetical protein